MGVCMSGSPQKAYLAPFVAFMGLLALGEIVGHFFEGRAFWMVSEPRYWIFPLQTVVCAGILIYYWRAYAWQPPARPVFTLAIAVLVLIIWISPQAFLGAAPRLDGFDP